MSKMTNRRRFMKQSALATVALAATTRAWGLEKERQLMSVTGPVTADQVGSMLIHEHLLVDFIGADKTGYHRWDRAKVVEKVLPYLNEVKALGCQTLADCTPAFLGRDPWLLKELSEKSGINILTNTGFYGAVNNKFIPSFAFEETAKQLANRWTKEYKKGIEGSGVKPGFIKISVGSGPLSDFHRRLITAAGITHQKTGLVIASHTGPALPAMEQLDVLEGMGVDANAFIWVHAQNEKDFNQFRIAGKTGAWVSFEGIRAGNVADTVARVMYMKEQGLLHRTLVSHDAGWYDPDKEEGGEFAPFTTIYTQLIPMLKNEGLTDKEVKVIFETNPVEAFAIR
ncbi:MAG: twin-arginine translocation signal domain-containing protein [Cyclobacteriaceae bacterium]|nr:twin-arginine translocation signal domain-containing protein [Cyclobacteriaceae bacterium]